MTKKPQYSTQFLSEEMLLAKDEFDFLYDEKIELPREYLERKRKRDMRKLVLHIVENELDEAKRDIFIRVFSDGEKIQDVALSMGISQSAVYKNYDKALKTIEQCLKYVVYYQNCCRNDKLMPLEVMKKYADASRRKADLSSISMRLSRLMQKNSISVKQLCLCTGINKKHFEQVFQGVSHLTDEEIALLSGFFGVTTDYILKGDSDWIKH